MTKTNWRSAATMAAAIALLTLTGSVNAQHDRRDHVSVAGRWMVSIAGPHSMAMRMTLEQDKTMVKGTFEDPHGGELQLTGTFVGRKLVLAVTSGSEMELAGELKDDGTLAGSLSGARGDFEWTAKRTAGND